MEKIKKKELKQKEIIMKNIVTFLSHKYLKYKKKDRNISLMIKVCFLGIAIGTFSLMLTLIITNGFEKVIYEKMQGINSQAIIYSPGNFIDATNIKKYLQKNFSKEIKATSASSTKQVLIDRNSQQSILFLKGIEPKEEEKVTTIADKIKLPLTKKPILSKLLKNNNIIIGIKTAQHFGLKIGDSITILIPEPGGKTKIFLKKKKAIISGLFKVGLEEYDNNFAICSIDFLHKLFREDKGVDLISIKFNLPKYSFKQKIINLFYKTDFEQKIINKLRKKMPTLTIKSWKELYPALVESLKLEKYVMFFILALIILVACMTMVSLLFMYIQQKRRDIAIYQSMGLSVNKIESIFLIIGLRITFWATIIGLTFAAIIGYLLEKYPIIQLPDVYYISYLPARMDAEIFLVVFIVTMILGFFATWIPVRRTRKIRIAQVLRQE